MPADGDWLFKTVRVGETNLEASRQSTRVKAAVKGGAPAMTLEKLILTPINRHCRGGRCDAPGSVLFAFGPTFLVSY